MNKSVFFHGLVSGIASATACVVYMYIYKQSMGVEYPTVFGPLQVSITCVIAGLLASFVYAWMFRKWNTTGEWIFNLAFYLFTFVSIMGPFATKLPLEVDMPELFPGLTVPMHFFPIASWFAFKPILKIKYN